MISVCPIVEKEGRLEWSASTEGSEATVRFVQSPKLNRILTTWHAVVNFLVPIGYEDEQGFHFGGAANPTEQLTWTI